MGLLKRYLAWTPLQKRLLPSALLLHAAVRVGLLLLPFRTVARLVARLARPAAHRAYPDIGLRDQIVWAVTRAHRHGPSRGACLQEALVGQLLLSRYGFPSDLRIGVRKSEDGKLQAHAWVEHGGEVVIGGPRSAVDTYSALRNMERIAPGG